MTFVDTEVETFTSAMAVGANKKLVVLGCGKLGTILLQAFLDRGLVARDQVIATVQHQDKCQALSQAMGGVAFSTDNRGAVAKADIVLICVK